MTHEIGPNRKDHGYWVVEQFYSGDRLSFIRRRYVRRTHPDGKGVKPNGVYKGRRQKNHKV